VNGHYLAIGTEQVSRRDVASTIKFAIEYFTLFLDSHVAALPAGLERANTPEAQDWRELLSQTTNDAWDRVVAFFASRNLREPTHVSYFKRAMYDLDASEWPAGPIGESHFQPALEGKKMKTRADLVENQVANRRAAEARRRIAAARRRNSRVVPTGSDDMEVEDEVEEAKEENTFAEV